MPDRTRGIADSGLAALSLELAVPDPRFVGDFRDALAQIVLDPATGCLLSQFGILIASGGARTA